MYQLNKKPELKRGSSMQNRNYHVVFGPNGGWAVRREGPGRAPQDASKRKQPR